MGEISNILIRLRELGVQAGDRVACLSFNTWEMLVLLLALARLGAMLAPLNYRLAAAEWDQLMVDCQPRLLLHDHGWAEACAMPASAASTSDSAGWYSGCSSIHWLTSNSMASRGWPARDLAYTPQKKRRTSAWEG